MSASPDFFIDDWQGLDGTLKRYAQRGDLSQVTPNIIEMTRFRFGQQLRAQSNEVRAVLSPVTDEPYYDLPANFVEMRAAFTLDTNGFRTAQLPPLSTAVLGRYPVSGSNAAGYTFTDGGNVIVGGTHQLQLVPNTGEDIEIVYWSIPDRIDGGTDTNATLLQWPFLYLYACMIEVHTYGLDFEARDSMKEIYDAELMTANQSSQKALLAAGAAVAPASGQHFGGHVSRVM